MTRTRKILIVEDEHVSADALVDLCAGDGHVAEAAGSTDDALEIAARLEPDLLLTDVVLGEERSGIDLARELAAEDEELAVVVMTGLTPSELASYAGGEPPFDVLYKPLRPSELRRTIADALSSRTTAC